MRKQTKRQRRSRARSELNLMMRLAAHINWFKSQPRLIHYLGRREPERPRLIRSRVEFDGEHSFQIAFMAWSAALQFPSLRLDPYKVLVYGMLHDFLNEWRYGDTPAFAKNGNGCTEVPCRKTKAERERMSRERLRRGLGKDMPFLMEWSDAYEAQADPECRFVYAFEKLVADINILQDRGHTNRVLDLDMQSVDLYKRPKISKDATVLEWYEELVKIWLTNEKKLFGRSRARQETEEVVS